MFRFSWQVLSCDGACAEVGFVYSVSSRIWRARWCPCVTVTAVYSWGRGEDGQLGLGDTNDQDRPVLVDALKCKGVVQVACGSGHTVVLSGECLGADSMFLGSRTPHAAHPLALHLEVGNPRILDVSVKCTYVQLKLFHPSGKRLSRAPTHAGRGLPPPATT